MVFNPNDWANTIDITINKDYIDQDLYNFPLSVVLNSGTGLYNQDMTDIFTQLTPASGIDQYTKFLCYFNGDQSSAKHIIDVVGNPQVISFNNNTNNPLLNDSASFNGTSAYLTVPNSVITTSTSTFTIDAWLYLDSSVVIADHSLLIGDQNPTALTSYWNFGPDDEDKLIFRWWTGSTYVAQSTNTIPLDHWTHVAVSVNSNAIKLFINGIEEVIVGTSTLSNRLTSLGYLSIGALNSNYFDGYMASIRITDTYKYSGNFTPPRAYTSDSNTKLLIDFTESGWGQLNTPATFTESGDTGYTVTNVSSNAVGCEFWWDHAMDFDGSTDYLIIPVSEDFAFGTGNFTLDVWVYPKQTGKHQRLFSLHNASTGWLLNINNTNTITYTNGAIAIASTSTIQIGVWMHVAVVRHGNDWDLYINGVSEDSTTSAASSIDNAINLQFGRVATQTGYDLNAYAAAPRITKGEALWTSNFDTNLPQGPYTTNSGTRFLLGFDGDISTSGHTIVFPGNNPRIYSSKGIFDGSYYFNGINDSLQVPDSTDWDFGTSNFTIDFWVYHDQAVSVYNEDLIMYFNGTSKFSWFIRRNTVGNLELFLSSNGTSWDFNQSTSEIITSDVWHHIAIIRDDNIIKPFIDGILATFSSTSYTNSLSTAADLLRIADSGPSTDCFEGYMSDIRISKGIARWTSDFAAPPVPYGNYSWHNRKKIAMTTTVTGVETEMPVEIEDWAENYVTRYPTEFSTNTVKATSYFSANYYPWFALDPIKNLTGTITDHSWATGSGQHTNQKFNVDLGTEKIIKRILLHNACHLGTSYTNNGIYNFSVYGTNSATAFSNTTYATITDLVLLGTFQARQHILEDIEDSQYFYLNNNNTYRYYILRVADDFGGVADATVIRHIEFQEYLEEAVLWTKVPTVTSGVDTELKLYYDKTQEDNNYVDPDIKLLIQDSFNDHSDSGHTITKYGSPLLKSFNANENPVLNNSAYFNGSSCYLTLPDHTDWNFGTDSFTIDWWECRITSSIGESSCSSDYAGSYRGLVAGDDDNAGGLDVHMSSNGSSWDIASAKSLGTKSLNQWVHLAVVRLGNNFYTFKNGVQQATWSSSLPLYYNNADFCIGASESGYYLNGYISGFRITKGIARWVSAFTPPRSYTLDTNTKLLINFTEAGWGQGKTPASFTDSGNTGHTVTNVSSYVSGCTFWWDKLLDFSGAGDLISVPDNVDFDFGTSDFSISLWVIFDSFPSSNTENMICKRTMDIYGPWQLGVGVSGYITFTADASTSAPWDLSITSSAPCVIGQIYHVEVVRASGAVTLYLDGVNMAYSATSPNILNDTNPVRMGGESGNRYLDGRLGHIQITNNVLHSSEFIPPSQPTSIGYIGGINSGQGRNVWDEAFMGVYHMNQNPTGGADCILDSTGYINHGTPAGSMTSNDLIVEGVGKSITFDGTNDVINLGSDTSLRPQSEVTLEALIKTTSGAATSRPILNNYTGTGDYPGCGLAIRTSNKAAFVPGNSFAINGIESITTVDDDTLRYVAGAYDGTNAKIIVNGVNEAEAAKTNNMDTALAMYISKDPWSYGRDLIDEARVSNISRSDAWLKATYYSNFNQLLVFDAYMPTVPTLFYFSSPIPVHQSTVYGTTKQLYLTVSVSGASPSYNYDATFYDGLAVKIGSTVSGVSAGQSASVSMSTISSGVYTWYVTATSSGDSDTSSTYQFTNRFLCEGYVEEQGVRTSGIPVRLHRRSNGEVIGNDVSSTVSGIFSIITDYNEEHYVVALHTDTTYNALIYDRITP